MVSFQATAVCNGAACTDIDTTYSVVYGTSHECVVDADHCSGLPKRVDMGLDGTIRFNGQLEHEEEDVKYTFCIQATEASTNAKELVRITQFILTCGSGIKLLLRRYNIELIMVEFL